MSGTFRIVYDEEEKSFRRVFGAWRWEEPNCFSFYISDFPDAMPSSATPTSIVMDGWLERSFLLIKAQDHMMAFCVPNELTWHKVP